MDYYQRLILHHNYSHKNNMDRIEVRIIKVNLADKAAETDKVERYMQECFDLGFRVMRADSAGDGVVYIFTRAVTQVS